MNTADSNTSLPEKKSGYTFGHNETLLLISLYQKYEVFFSGVSYKKPVIRGMCLLSFVYRTAKTFGKSKTVSLFSSSSLFTRKIAAITASMAASLSAAILVTQCLLVSGPHILTCVFLCRQSKLFLAFRTNHSYPELWIKKRALSCNSFFFCFILH